MLLWPSKGPWIIAERRGQFLEEMAKPIFWKKNIVPPHIVDNTELQNIAECFKQSFSAACFNSYADKASVAELQAKLSGVDVAHVTENVFCQWHWESA